MARPIYAFTTVFDDYDLLPHWCEHYRRLGVDDVVVAVGYRHDEDLNRGVWWRRCIVPDVIDICRPFDARVFVFTHCDYDACVNDVIRPRINEWLKLNEDDWCIYADLDEFYTYPAPIKDIAAAMEEHNDWAIEGRIIDRVVEDGSLPPVLETPQIGLQYPIGCDLTGQWIRANTRKIVLCRARVIVNSAHDNTRNAYFHIHRIGTLADYQAHHFRWTQRLIERLRRRVYSPGIADIYRAELKRFLDYWDMHRRLPVESYNPRYLGAFEYAGNET